MAKIDTERGVAILRIVYDGPPEAGKTTSLRKLGESLERPVTTHDQEDGRTVWFDWMDYVGGFFQGHPIRCQVVTVPGQEQYWERRRTLLSEADAVVFVADSQTDRQDETLRAMNELRELLARREPTPGLVLQANKRDLPDIVALDDLRERLSEGEVVAVTESVASEGLGIRETFVLAVRLALDRLRASMDEGIPVEGRPEVDDADQLLAQLREASPEPLPEKLSLPRDELQADAAADPQAPTAPPEASARTTRPQRSDDPTDPDAPPSFPPNADIPVGLVWPPVSGRVILHEAATQNPQPIRLARGGWADFGNRWWLIHSPAAARYEDLERGREQLLEWARRHTVLESYLSSQRSIVLSSSGARDWRLWQVVRRREPLALRLVSALSARRADEAAEVLLQCSRALTALRGTAESRSLDPTLENVGWEEDRPVLIRLLPPPSEPFLPDAGAETDAAEDVEPELARWVEPELAAWPEGRRLLRDALESLLGDDDSDPAERVRGLVATAS